MPPKRFGAISIEFDNTADDLVSAALAMLAYGLSGLPAAGREAQLQQIEDGKLRTMVGRFVASEMTPTSPRNPFVVRH